MNKQELCSFLQPFTDDIEISVEVETVVNGETINRVYPITNIKYTMLHSPRVETIVLKVK